MNKNTAAKLLSERFPAFADMIHEEIVEQSVIAGGIVFSVFQKLAIVYRISNDTHYFATHKGVMSDVGS